MSPRRVRHGCNAKRLFGTNEYLGHGLTTDSQNRILGQMVINIFTPKGTGPGANYVIGKRSSRPLQ